MFYEHVAGKSDYVLLDQGIPISEEVHAVGGKQMLELQPVETGCVSLFDIEIVLVVIPGIHYADTKGFGISKDAIVDSVHIEVVDYGLVSTRFQDRVDLL